MLIKKRLSMFLTIILTACMFLSGCSGMDFETNEKTISGSPSTAGLTVHFIDVGQGDSQLIESDGHFMLVDAGENDQGEQVVQYLKNAGVTKLDYVIGTHPHSDHIGGLDTVINAFDVETVILPPKEHTTKTFEDVLDAIDEKGLGITKAVPDTNYRLGNASFTIIAPVKEYGDDLNNWSVGIHLTYGSTSFVMTGDAEAEAEADMAKAFKSKLKSNVLKLGHHGSSTSSTEEFLDMVLPEYVVISCGAGNSYGHPHKEIVKRLEERQIKAYRTDELGSIIADSDGTAITWIIGGKTVVGVDKPGQPDSFTYTYILNTNSKKFHLPECTSVSDIKKEHKQSYMGDKNELLEQGYSPCKRCNP